MQQAFYVTGAADFILIVTAADVAQFESIMARLLADNPNVRRFTTSVAMSLVKRGLTIPLPGTPA